MFRYYIELAIREMRHHPVLAFLISLQLAVGVGVFISCTQLQVELSRDPLPGRSKNLYHVQLEPRSAKFALDGIEPPSLLTYIDAKALLKSAWGTKQSISVGGAVKVVPVQADKTPFFVDARAASSDFFEMFNVPVIHGSTWDKAADDRSEKVAVISRSLSNKLFQSENGVGQTLRLGSEDYQVIGVIGDWSPQPRFFDLQHVDKYGAGDAVFLPFNSVSNIDGGTWGDVDCWETPTNSEHYSNQPCFWINYWVQLPDEAARRSYFGKLVAYSLQQKAMGRYGVAQNVRLRNLPTWLEFSHAVPSEVKFESWLSLGFLAVCLVNLMGLLLTKFSQMTGVIGTRRAMGASRRSILFQLMTESLMYGVTGGLAAMLATSIGIAAVRWQSGYVNQSKITLAAIGASFFASLLIAGVAGFLPAWRCLKMPIHLQIKAS